MITKADKAIAARLMKLALEHAALAEKYQHASLLLHDPAQEAEEAALHPKRRGRPRKAVVEEVA